MIRASHLVIFPFVHLSRQCYDEDTQTLLLALVANFVFKLFDIVSNLCKQKRESATEGKSTTHRIQKLRYTFPGTFSMS